MTPQEVVNDLISRFEMSQKDIADEVGSTQASICRISKGTQVPGYLLAKELFSLHEKRESEQVSVESNTAA